jgi:predicted N-formylglutamate amidohydrolase
MTSQPHSPLRELTDAYEVYSYPEAGPLILSCEHASARVPPPLQTTASDREWLDTHWALDIGARAVTLAIAACTRSPVVLARFSRLVCDPNRHRHRDDMILRSVEGVPLSFNQDIDDTTVRHRIDTYHEPFHQALDRVLTERLAHPAPALFISVHSFTPIWEKRLRTMDIGILFDGYDDEARALQRELEAEGFFVELNAPYSALGTGLMYSADRHGREHNIKHLELEFNQALICTPERCRRVAHRVADAILRIHPIAQTT